MSFSSLLIALSDRYDRPFRLLFRFRVYVAVYLFTLCTPHSDLLPSLPQAFPRAAFTPLQARILKHCRKIGLAYQLNERSPVVYPTQLALLLARESAAVEEKDKVRRGREEPAMRASRIRGSH